MNKEIEIKEKIKERYGNIALFGNSDYCCMPASSQSSNCCEGDGSSSSTNLIENLSLLSSVKSIGI